MGDNLVFILRVCSRQYGQLGRIPLARQKDKQKQRASEELQQRSRSDQMLKSVSVNTQLDYILALI